MKGASNEDNDPKQLNRSKLFSYCLFRLYFCIMAVISPHLDQCSWCYVFVVAGYV